MGEWLSALLNSSITRWCGVPQAHPLIREALSGTTPIQGNLLWLGNENSATAGLKRHLAQLPGVTMLTPEQLAALTKAPAKVSVHTVVFDGTALQSTAELDLLLTQLQPALALLANNAAVVILSTSAAHCITADAAATATAFEGFGRSLAKELGRFGSRVNVLSLDTGADTLAAVQFFLSPRSAYITGQVIKLRASTTVQPLADWQQPLKGKTALVTGAARGIGAAIARRLTAQGALVIGLDIAASEPELTSLMLQLQGKSLPLDISQPDSADQLIHYLQQQGLALDILVHNAGITRDKLFWRMSQSQWQQTLDVNVRSVQRIDQALLQQRLIRPQGRVLLLSSMNGLAGQKGQTNYASSKAALVGYCQFMAEHNSEGITFNAVAPGFIETQMTAAMPVLPREIGRRLNSLLQAGVPDDVAQAVAFFARPDAAACNGVVLRVCGQCLIGA
jgi:3-oxoacyl-[acyl-carrier protein] reductase